MPRLSKSSPAGFDQRFLALTAAVIILIVLVLTWIGIRESRADSMELLVLQGTAFTEALAQAAENAIVSETFFDYLVHKRYSEIAVALAAPKATDLTDQLLGEVATSHNLYGLYVFGADSNLLAGASVRMPVPGLPEYVLEEVRQLIGEPENNYILLLDEGATPDQTIHYYLEISNQFDRVTLVVADALYYTEALEQTQIGFLAQSMSREQGVEYIMYQTTEGIVFSSRKTGEVLAIESDPFLAAALESDTITHRVHPVQDKNVLELVRPFSSAEFPFGLLRVGVSLDGYYSIQKRFDRQMIGISAALVVVLLLSLLYLNSRQKRKEIARR